MDRRRGLLVMVAVFVPLTVVASVASPGDRVLTAVGMTVAFAVLVLIVMAMWDYRPSWWANGPGLLKDLEPEERRLVTAAARSGRALADPRLARVASAVAAGTAKGSWFLIAAGAVNLVIQLRLLVGGGHRPLAVELLGAGIWVVYLAFAVHRLTRARRAEAGNRSVLAALSRQ